MGRRFDSCPPHVSEQGWRNVTLFLLAILLGLGIWILRAFFGLQVPGID